MLSPERSHCFSYKRSTPEELESLFGVIEGENRLENRLLRKGAGILLETEKGKNPKSNRVPQGIWNIESGSNVRVIAEEKILDWLERGLITASCFKSKIPK